MSDKPVPTVDEVLEGLETEWTQDRYCRNTFARDTKNQECHYYNDDATKFCGIGFIRYLTFDHREFDSYGYIISDEHYNKIEFPEHPLYKEYQSVKDVAVDVQFLIEQELPCSSIVAVNDTPNGFSILKKAIQKARQKKTLLLSTQTAGEEVHG